MNKESPFAVRKEIIGYALSLLGGVGVVICLCVCVWGKVGGNLEEFFTSNKTINRGPPCLIYI